MRNDTTWKHIPNHPFPCVSTSLLSVYLLNRNSSLEQQFIMFNTSSKWSQILYGWLSYRMKPAGLGRPNSAAVDLLYCSVHLLIIAEFCDLVCRFRRLVTISLFVFFKHHTKHIYFLETVRANCWLKNASRRQTVK